MFHFLRNFLLTKFNRTYQRLLAAKRRFLEQVIHVSKGAQKIFSVIFRRKSSENTLSQQLLRDPELISRESNDQNNQNSRYFRIIPLRREPEIIRYPTRIYPEQSLARIAENPESAMQSIGKTQEDVLSQLKHQYQRDFRSMGSTLILNNLKNYMVRQYHSHPAKSQGKVLDLQNMQQTTTLEKQALYQNPHATAYRYLFCHPNPLLSRDASFTQGQSAVISAEDLDTIAHLWLAISDPKYPLPQGYTQGQIKDLFIDTLSHIGRAHNWDNPPRQNIRGQMEEYDDLQGDKPSCDRGVKTRLTQFLMVLMQNKSKPKDHVLNPRLMKLRFQENLIAENTAKDSCFDKIGKLSLAEIDQLSEAVDTLTAVHLGDMDGFDENDPLRKLLLEVFTIPPRKITDFIQGCKTYYGGNRINKQQPMLKWEGEADPLKGYENLIHYFAKNAVSIFYSTIKTKILQRKTELNSPKKNTSPQWVPMEIDYNLEHNLRSFFRRRQNSVPMELDTTPVPMEIDDETDHEFRLGYIPMELD